MFTRKLPALVCALVIGAGAAHAADSPNLGTPVTNADIAAWDISIGPSGEGLPPGSGTATAGANGTIDPASTMVDSGDTAVFTITPNTGYDVADVVVELFVSEEKRQLQQQSSRGRTGFRTT